MSEYIQILDHKGKQILFFNCRGMKPDDQVSLFPEVTRTCIERRINRVLVDITDSSSNEAVKLAAKEFLQKVAASMGAAHAAMVGVKGIQRIIAQAVVKDMFFAKTKEEGLDYLAEKH